MDEAGDGRASGKRDRLARLTRIVAVLQAHPAGIRPAEVAERVGMSVRTVYRDFRAIDGELGIPTWADDGRWGIDQERAFLPPLKFTQSEAMAVVLAARLMVRYADKYDPDLASAFEKLERGLPAALAEHVDRSLDVLQRAPRADAFSRTVHLLTRAWAERRVVSIDYEPGRYEAGAQARRATVRPYLLEPSVQTHALYLVGWDETRDAIRTFKVERIRAAALTPRTFEPPPSSDIEASLRRAWDIIADQPETTVVVRFSSKVAARVGEATWHPTQQIARASDGSLTWQARVAGTIEVRLWILSWGDDAEVLEPPALRDDVRRTLEHALEPYGS